MHFQPLTAPVIIGGGPAGTAAAIRLARAGQSPILLERNAEPADKVCGDFLGADATSLLLDLGIDPASLGAASIQRVRVVHRQQVAETSLPFAALSLSRRMLDAALLQRARAVGADVRRGTAVRRLSRDAAGWRLDSSADPLNASTVFLATGKHDMREHPRPGTHTGAVGMKTYLRLGPRQAAALAGSTELYLFPGGYAGLQPVEDGKVVLCAALRHGRFRHWTELIDLLTAATPLLRDRLAGAEALLARPLAVAGIPYGMLQRHAGHAALFRLGDQAAVIPSLTGDGIAIALHSGSLAARCWLDRQDAETYQRRLAAGLAGQMQLATTLHTLAINGVLQPAVLRAASLFPSILQWFATATRIRRPLVRLSGPATGGLHPA